MKRIFKQVKSKKTKEIYSVLLTYDEGNLIDFSCTCRFMSFDYWSKKYQASGTICRHILQVCTDEGIELPEKNKTERNLRIMKTFKK